MTEHNSIGNVDPDIIDRLKLGLSRLSDNDDIFSNRYSKNIQVIEKYFPDIFKEIKDYQPKNSNVFLEKDGALNLFFPDTGFTLFSDEPFKQIDDKYNAFVNNPKRTIVNIDTSLSDRSRHEYYLTRVNHLKKKQKEKLKAYDVLPDIVGGIILFGFDLGYQLTRILDEHFVKHIYIYESNLDMFYYSLFAIDWEWVVHEMETRDSTIHFFLGIDEKEFSSQYISNLRFNGMYMAAHTYLYMGYSYEHIDKVIEEFNDKYVRQIMGWGFFDDGVIGIAQYLSRSSNTYLAVIPSYEAKPGFNKKLDVPVFILGNGPSLDKEIEFVKANRDNAIIVSCGTTINTLYKYGIKPDYHADVERMRHTAEKLEFLDKDYLSGIIGLTVNVMHPDFYHYFDKSIIGLKPSEPISSVMQLSDLVSPENRKRLQVMNFSGPIVANLALSYMSQMGFSDIYVIGVDCGFKDPNNHHSKVSGYYKNDGSNTGLAEYTKGLIRRPGNFGGDVFSTSIMDTSRVQLQMLIELTKKKNKLFQCFNMSDGVLIKGAVPLLAEDALIFDLPPGEKELVKKYVWEHCTSEEKTSIDDSSIEKLYDDYKLICDEFIEILSSSFQDKKELLLLLSKMNSLLMKQYFNGKNYNAELMMGSFVYFSNEIVDLLMYSKETSLEVLNELMDYFKQFVSEMPEHIKNYKQFVDTGNDHLTGRYNA